MIKYFTGELASKLIGKEDDTIVIAYANQIANDKLAIKIRDKVNNTHGLVENIIVKADDESVVVTIEATRAIPGICDLYDERKPATFKRSEFELDELADHIMLVITSYHESRLENNETLERIFPL